MALSLTAIRRHSSSLLRFPFLSHVRIFSCYILLVYGFFFFFFFFFLLLLLLLLLLLFYSLRVFHINVSLWSFPEVWVTASILNSPRLFSILADLNSLVVWMASTRPVISKSSNLFNNPSMTVPRGLITVGINVTFIFHSFFQFPSMVGIFILLFTFFQYYPVVSRDVRVFHSSF